MRLGAHQNSPLSLTGNGAEIATRGRRLAALAMTASSLLLAIAASAASPVLAADAAAAAPAPTSDPNEVVVNGIPYRETVLPTRLKSSSVYGLDLNVMDTPRNTTLLSTTQLNTLNIQDPRAFSYLTASSYTGSAFGTPNIPAIRGQYADVFINGMRSSFTDNGYGVAPDFDSVENISITKGPASVIDGPGPGVGGQADLLTKRPSLAKFQEGGSFSVDTVGNRRLVLDIGGPIIPGELGVRLSYSGAYSDSYIYSLYNHKNALYAAVRWKPNDKYQLDFNSEVMSENYTEDVGLNRVNQALIDHHQYATGAPTGEVNSSYFGFGDFPIQVGSPGNPYSPVAPFLTVLQLGNPVTINTRRTVDQAPGTSTRVFKYNAQLIQTYDFNNNLTLENNTFFDYQDSDNQEQYYYADASRGSWTFENRTDLTGKFELPFSFGDGPVENQYVVGATFRFAHTNYISNYSAETPSVYDLTSNPALWVNDGPTQIADADSFLYKTSLGRLQYGTPGRDTVNGGNTGISNLYDGGIFFQDRISFTPQLSALFGARIDAVQDHTYDPLGGVICANCFTALPDGSPVPQSHSTGVYGLGDANVSIVYKFRPEVSAYVTVDATQTNNPDGGEGGINAYGLVPDSKLLRVDSYLYEVGLKLNLLNNKLFVGSAVFDQKRQVPTGPGGTATSQANIRGVEIEANYQPVRNLFVTSSYSYIKTTLNTPAGFYNYPVYLGAQYTTANTTIPAAVTAYNPNGLPGNFVDGAGTFAVFAPGQKFDDPGTPQHIFNFLGNYKFDNGIGFRTGLQVTGPINLTSSGQLDLAASQFVPQSVINNGGYYKSPVIPWQYTWNLAVFYEWGKYTATVSVYNLTDRLNWQSSPSFYGNDFLVRNDPRTVEFRLQAKF